MSMGVRRRDTDLRDSLQTVIEKKGPEIQGILRKYGVPLLPVIEEKREPERTGAAPGGDTSPGAGATAGR
jgi:hypothetical protein